MAQKSRIKLPLTENQSPLQKVLIAFFVKILLINRVALILKTWEIKICRVTIDKKNENRPITGSIVQ